jgi:hypothetical protein
MPVGKPGGHFFVKNHAQPYSQPFYKSLHKRKLGKATLELAGLQLQGFVFFTSIFYSFSKAS